MHTAATVVIVDVLVLSPGLVSSLLLVNDLSDLELVEAEADKEMPFAQAAASIVDNRNQVDAVNTVSNQKRGIENANQVLDSDSLMY